MVDPLSNYVSLINRYPEVDPLVLEGYLPYETEVILNKGDPDLFPIPVDIVWMWKKVHTSNFYKEPKGLPAPHEIDGFGLPIHEQKFRREKYPQSLRDLEKNVKNKVRSNRKNTTMLKKEIAFLDTMWETLSKERHLYYEEIQWIEKMWYHRFVGKWMYIYGKPTYIPGWCWWFMNLWYVDDGRPIFKDRDRRWFVAQVLSSVDDRDFVKKNSKTFKALPEPDGTYKMYSTGRLISLGTTNTKSRRVGDTTKTQAIMGEVSTRSKDAKCGIQGADKDNGEDVFKSHYVRNIHKLWWFFKPIPHQLNPREVMEFSTDDPSLSMDSSVDYATTADRSYYDGKRLRIFHRDEPGKVKHENINKAHTVTKQCLTLNAGKDIKGQAFYTTTVEEMNRRGGENYAKLCRASHFNVRNKNGQTMSGMTNIFFKASDGLFVDQYGYSIIGKPTPEQAKFIGSDIGADEWIENDRYLAILNQDFDLLSELKRMYPQQFREAFTPPPQNEFFNTIILNNNYQMLILNQDATVQGNLYWIQKHKSVIFKLDPNGKFFFSKYFIEGESNQMVSIDGIWYPRFPDKYLASADAFRFEKTDGGRMSNGGGCTRWLYDPLVDPEGTPEDLKQTARTIISYNHRPPTIEEYCEDMLMMCILTGAMMYPEMNVTHVADYFIENNFDGFLLYDTDPATGLPKANPGFSTTGKSKQKAFNLAQADIERNGERNRHIDQCSECMSIPDMDAMTDFDLFTSYIGTLLGEESKMAKNMSDERDKDYDTTDWFETY